MSKRETIGNGSWQPGSRVVNGCRNKKWLQNNNVALDSDPISYIIFSTFLFSTAPLLFFLKTYYFFSVKSFRDYSLFFFFDYLLLFLFQSSDCLHVVCCGSFTTSKQKNGSRFRLVFISTTSYFESNWLEILNRSRNKTFSVLVIDWALRHVGMWLTRHKLCRAATIFGSIVFSTLYVCGDESQSNVKVSWESFSLSKWMSKEMHDLKRPIV